nr:hypothetical protein Iba_chr08aCG8650 [Ipomoea batatas]
MKTSSTTSDYVHQQRLFDICIVLRIYLKQALRFEKSLPEVSEGRLMRFEKSLPEVSEGRLMKCPSLIALSWVPLILASNSAEDSALPADAPAAIPFRLLLIMDDSSKGFELVGIATLSWLRSIRDWRNASAALCATREACSSSFNFSSS